MSLVNDMLRDLDARRRDAPGGSLGAERLVPAVDYARERRTRVPASFWLITALLVSVLLVATLYFVLDTGMPSSLSIDVPVQAAGVSPPANADPALGQELERLNRRMQELEASNRQLQEEASRAQLQSVLVRPPATMEQAGAEPSVTMPVSEASVSSVPQVAQDTAVWTPRTWQAETQVDASYAVRAMPAPVQQRTLAASNASVPVVGAMANNPAAPTGSTLVRSPRELTLSERDRLQVQQSLQLWQAGQQSASLASLQDYLAREPMAHQSREILAKLLLQQGDTLTAMDLTDGGLQLAPAHVGFRKIKARVLMAAGVPAEAAALLEHAAPVLTADTEYHDLLASARLSSHAYDDAADTYKALVQIDPQQSRWWYGLAAAQDGNGRTYEAAQAYEKALQLGNLSANLRQTSQQRIASIRQQ